MHHRAWRIFVDRQIYELVSLLVVAIGLLRVYHLTPLQRHERNELDATIHSARSVLEPDDLVSMLENSSVKSPFGGTGAPARRLTRIASPRGVHRATLPIAGSTPTTGKRLYRTWTDRSLRSDLDSPKSSKSTTTFNTYDSKSGLVSRHPRKTSVKSVLFKGVHRKHLKGNRWISHPRQDAQNEWNHEEDRATEWLSLFYDLIVVAVLGVFMTQHEVDRPAAIPIFLSFFSIIFWTWASQTSYDMRFQGDDALNRFFKFLQVILFIYQGASSGNWNPGKIQIWSEANERTEGEGRGDDYGAELAEHRDALKSWLTVVVAYAVSRGILAAQYGICAYQGHKAKRNVKHILLTIDALCVSLVLCIISAALPSESYQMRVAKITIFYLAIVIEVGDEWSQVLFKMSHHVPTDRIGERYGAFLLIIIGEGIIMINRAFSKAITGLSDDDASTYSLVFLTMVVVYLLWSFLFSNFDKNDHTGHGRVAIWQTLHFPLTFGILLLMAGTVNVVVVTSAAHGISLVLADVGSVANTTLSTGYMPGDEVKRANRYMYKLTLEPSFPVQIEYLDKLQSELKPSEDWYIVLDQYIGQIIYNTFTSYGIEIPSAADKLYDDLYAVDPKWHYNMDTQEHARARADELLEEFVSDIMVDIFTGILWVLPAAGCVLILAALRSMTWYRFTGTSHHLLHVPQILFGVTLCLLGLLDLGPKSFDIQTIIQRGHFSAHNDVNPLYRLLLEKAPLVIVASVYFVVWLVTAGGLWWKDRREQRRRDEQAGHLDEGDNGAVPLRDLSRQATMTSCAK